eukprot:tig00000473_g1203.t1
MPADMAHVATPIVEIVRREQFSACHRLHNPKLSDEENREIYGKCNNPNGHGHNYVMEVTLRGPVDPVTGMVMNLVDVKRAIHKAVFEQMDHKNLDKDVPAFRDTGLVSTTENLAVVVFNQLRDLLPAGILHQVKIWETENNIAIYRGE